MSVGPHRFTVAAAALTCLILTTSCSFDLDAVLPPGGTDQGLHEAGTGDATPDGPALDGPLVDLALPDGPVPDTATVDGPLSDGPVVDQTPVDQLLVADAQPDGPLADLAKADLAKVDLIKSDAPQPDKAAAKPDAVQLDKAITSPDGPASDVGKWCGNGVIYGIEQCDGANLNNKTCKTQGFVSGTLKCHSTTCQFDTTGCNKCGNGIIDSPEQCDTKAAPGVTCKGQKFTGGTMGCTDKCLHDTSDCYKVLDPGGVVITNKPRDPSIACGGGKCLVVWYAFATKKIMGRLVDPATGKLVGATEIEICSRTELKMRTTVVYDGSSFLAAWVDYRLGTSKPAVYGARVTTAGAVIDYPNNLPLVTTVAVSMANLTSAGKGSLLAYNSSGGVHGVFVGQDGLVVAGAPVRLDTGSLKAGLWPSLAALPTYYAMGWQDGSSSGSGAYGKVRMFDSALKALGTAPTQVQSGVYNANPVMAPIGGTHFVGVWLNQNKANAAWLFYPPNQLYQNCGAGSVICVNGDCSYPKVAGGGGKALFIRRVVGASSDRLEAVGMTKLCAGFTPPLVLRSDHATAKIDEKEIGVASYGSGYMAIWPDDRKNPNGSDDLYFARVHW